MVSLLSSAVVVKAGPLEDVVNWCKNETNAPAQAIFMTKKMPDGKLRGTRSAAVLTAEARKAKAAGDCGKALEWMIHCVDHDAGAQNVLRADPAKTCSLL
jgi:hypothetical protein